MKTITNKIKSKFNTTVRGMLIVSAVLISSANLHAQNKSPDKAFHLGLGLESYSSGNAHGAFYTGQLLLTKGRNTLGFGPVLQKRSLMTKGIKASYSLLIADRNNPLSFGEPDPDMATYGEMLTPIDNGLFNVQVRLFSYLQYVHQLPLSYRATRIESFTHPEATFDRSNLRLCTTEGGVGIQIDLIINKLVLKNYIGASVFYHNTYTKGMYHERASAALIVGTGINVSELF